MMSLPFRDPSRPRAERVADLLSRLTLDEKLGLVHQYQAPVERLGIEPFKTGTEAAHGVAWLGEATVFPQVVALGATWNPELVERVGAAVADEVLAKHRADPERVSRNVWAPTVNPLRDPRWGRNEEGFSEDAWAVGLMSSAYARGLKGDNGSAQENGVWKTAPTIKHFLAYGHETDRGTKSSRVPPRALHEYEFAAQRPALAGGHAVGAMLSYNFVNGRPAHVSPLVNDELRTWTDDEVLVVSDAYGPSAMVTIQGYFDDLITAYAAAVKAGLDSFTQDDDRSSEVLSVLTAALERGLLDEDDIDRAVRRNLTVRFGLGEFDSDDPFAHIGPEAINSPQHRALARETATQSITLLKNDGVLPFTASMSIAVIGPLAGTQMQDWYSGTLPYAVTARQGLGERVEVSGTEGVDRIRLRYKGRYVVTRPGAVPVLGEDLGPESQFDLLDWGDGYHFLRSVATGQWLTSSDDGDLLTDLDEPLKYEPVERFRLVDIGDSRFALHQIHPNDRAPGGKWIGVDEDRLVLTVEAEAAAEFEFEFVHKGPEVAAALAEDADVAVVVLGNHPLINGRENEDRAGLALPPAQERLLRAVCESNPNTVVVLSSSYPYAVDWAAAHARAIVWSGHGGQEWGRALADVLLGDRDPEGRLPQTWYAADTELPEIHDCDIVGAEATYLYFAGRPLFPFGHGLSYTNFAYANLRTDRDRVDPGDLLRVTVDVTNTGGRAGTEVVQLYSRQTQSRVKQPLRRLRAFEKISLAAGESRTVEFTIAAADFAHWDTTTGRMVVERSVHDLMIGRSCADFRLTTSVHVDGEVIGPRDLSRPLAAAMNDACSGVAWRDASRTAGDVIASEEPDGWLVFRDCDFTPGYATATVRVAGRAARLVLRAGDPLKGEVLAEFVTPDTQGIYDFEDVTAELVQADGVLDLYVTFSGSGTRFASLVFGEAGR